MMKLLQQGISEWHLLACEVPERSRLSVFGSVGQHDNTSHGLVHGGGSLAVLGVSHVGRHPARMDRQHLHLGKSRSLASRQHVDSCF